MYLYLLSSYDTLSSNHVDIQTRQQRAAEQNIDKILTYCCRNVSVGRVIGIHIGRVMGGGEHSVVVDSESWTMDNEEENKSDSDQCGHTTEDSERKTTGGMWYAGMRQS